MQDRKIVFLLDNLAAGGAERVVLSLAGSFAAAGFPVDLLVCELRGELRDAIPAGVELQELGAASRPRALLAAFAAARRGVDGGVAALLATLWAARKIPRSLRYIPALRGHLAARRPAVLFAALPKANVCAVLAAAGSAPGTAVFLGIQNALSVRAEQGRRGARGQQRHMLPLLRACYRQAQGVVASSAGVADDALQLLDLDPALVHVVHNPVQLGPVDAAGDAPPHPWLAPGEPPVVLGIGRLVAQKNFPLLLRAFAALRRERQARLLIVGGDPASTDQQAHAGALAELARELGIEASVGLVGYQPNPQDYLVRAAVFVLSSRHEGFANVLVEALLAGCPIVSTDCPSGPAEILDGGKYGRLVPVDDSAAMAAAVRATLDAPPPARQLRERGAAFSPGRAATAYRRIFFGD